MPSTCWIDLPLLGRYVVGFAFARQLENWRHHLHRCRLRNNFPFWAADKVTFRNVKFGDVYGLAVPGKRVKIQQPAYQCIFHCTPASVIDRHIHTGTVALLLVRNTSPTHLVLHEGKKPSARQSVKPRPGGHNSVSRERVLLE